MDIRLLVSKLSSRHHSSVHYFERGRVQRRTHAEVYDDVQKAMVKLRSLGVKAGSRVGIRAPNCYEWVTHDLALIELRAVSVALTEDLQHQSAEELCAHYRLSLLLVSVKERDRHAEDSTFVAYLDGERPSARAMERAAGDDDPEFLKPWLIFSSGSAGGLKGLLLNRKGVEASIDVFVDAVAPQADDCALLFLPISNFQQRLIYYAAFWYGFDVIITDPMRLFPALETLRPTILIAPPMLYESIETRFDNQPRWKRLAARTAGEMARRLPTANLRQKAARRIFAAVHRALGGRMRLLVTGMAPIKRSTLELFEIMGLPLYETYGLIECGSVALNVPNARKLGSVGRVLPGVRVDLATDGEIIVHKEHMIAFGYFQCADGEQERTFLADGRVATGDIGRVDAEGFLHLVGRKKEIVVTAGGEKVHPEAVEAELDACPDVAKSAVFGRAASLVAIVLPKDPGDAAARARIERHAEAVGQRNPRMNLGAVVFTDQTFTRENGFLRPNLKLDRRKIAEHFQTELGTQRTRTEGEAHGA